VRGWGAALLLPSLALGAGCERLGSFDLEPGESYCGQITLGSRYRSGFSPRVQLRMSFDADAVAAGKSPGSITTYDGGAEESQRRLLDGGSLRPIEPLSHDALSDLDLGDGRDLSYIYAVTPADPDAESLVAFVTLRDDDTVEVRLLRPGTAPEGNAAVTPAERQLFGLFVLQRQKGDCGF
jgi:hypothetical protein